MPFSLTKEEGRLTLTLAGEVTIRDARKLAASLADGVAEPGQVCVETAELTDIDTCILQLLCALQKTVPELVFAEPGEKFLSALDRSQLRKALLGAREMM
jgi:ABC-type transporter Mla MlaB component